MRVAVRLASGLAARAGRSNLILDLPAGATAETLFQTLVREVPDLAQFADAVLTVAQGRVLGPQDLLVEGEEVALLLPMPGGY